MIFQAEARPGGFRMSPEHAKLPLPLQSLDEQKACLGKSSKLSLPPPPKFSLDLDQNFSFFGVYKLRSGGEWDPETGGYSGEEMSIIFSPVRSTRRPVATSHVLPTMETNWSVLSSKKQSRPVCDGRAVCP